MLVDIDDSNLLRLRVLQVLNGVEGTMSDYLNMFLAEAIDDYACRILAEPHEFPEIRMELLEEMTDRKAINCGSFNIALEIPPEDAAPIRSMLERHEFEEDCRRLQKKDGMCVNNVADSVMEKTVQDILDEVDPEEIERIRKGMEERMKGKRKPLDGVNVNKMAGGISTSADHADTGRKKRRTKSAVSTEMV